MSEAANLQNRSVEFTLFLTLAGGGRAAGHVRTDRAAALRARRLCRQQRDTDRGSAILAIFGLGLPAFVLIKAFTPGYFAREDTRTPMIFAAISVAVNVSDRR